MATILPETASDGKALTDAWDYKGRPASRATTGGWGCAAMILGTLIYLPFRFRHMTCAIPILCSCRPCICGTDLGSVS